MYWRDYLLDDLWPLVVDYVAGSMGALVAEPGLGHLFWVVKPAYSRLFVDDCIHPLIEAIKQGHKDVFCWLWTRTTSCCRPQTLYQQLGRVMLQYEQIDLLVWLFARVRRAERTMHMRELFQWVLLTAYLPQACEWLYTHEAVTLLLTDFHDVIRARQVAMMKWCLQHLTQVDWYFCYCLAEGHEQIDLVFKEAETYRASFVPAYYHMHCSETLMRYWLDTVDTLRERGWLCTTTQAPHLWVRRRKQPGLRLTLGECTDSTTGLKSLFWWVTKFKDTVPARDVFRYLATLREEASAACPDSTKDTAVAKPVRVVRRTGFPVDT